MQARTFKHKPIKSGISEPGQVKTKCRTRKKKTSIGLVLEVTKELTTEVRYLTKKLGEFNAQVNGQRLLLSRLVKRLDSDE